MGTEAQESPINKKLLALVSVVLALVLVAFCFVVFLLIRNKLTARPAQPQLAQPEIPLPTLETSVQPVIRFLPVVVNSVAPASAPAPTAITVPTATLWRFVSINAHDFGTFENVNDPSQRLVAKCKDPNRPAPGAGELYRLDNSGNLKPQNGGKKFQRFELITRK
jgi:hypothetical protein